jgi:hypothetical protein
MVLDYAKTIIYKLVRFDDLNDDNIYVGYCTNYDERYYNHRRNAINKEDYLHTSNYKVYQFIRENGGWDNWRMKIIEEYPCDNVDQARARERYWKRELNATLNMREPCRTNKEYYQDNKEYILQRNKEWRENNKEYIAEYNKVCDKTKKKEREKSKLECPLCGLEVTRYKLKRHQEGRNCKNIVRVELDEENKEKQRIKNNEYYSRRYYEKRDEILQKQKDKRDAKNNNLTIN